MIVVDRFRASINLNISNVRILESRTHQAHIVSGVSFVVQILVPPLSLHISFNKKYLCFYKDIVLHVIVKYRTLKTILFIGVLHMFHVCNTTVYPIHVFTCISTHVRQCMIFTCITCVKHMCYRCSTYVLQVLQVYMSYTCDTLKHHTFLQYFLEYC